jgi:tetratricopeptide (TPR) repeat protein
MGNDLRVEFKAVGDTVNLASRMEGLAEPGATYVTAETFKLTEGLFRVEALGEREVKGKEKPTNVYRVIAPSTRRTRFDVSAERGLTPFVGRERELELLMDERCKSGRGQAFSIMAEAGVGKSRLLYEFRKAVANEDVTFLEGKCLSYSRSIAYHPIIDILKSNFNIQGSDRDHTIREKVRNGLKILELDDEMTGPYLLELLLVKNGDIDREALGPEMMKVRITEALKRIVLKGSEIQPLIMVVEDLHWIDRSSEEHFKELLDHISGARVLLIFTYRPEFVQSWGGKSYHNQVNVNRLSNRESLTMVTHLLGSDEIDKELEELIINKTEGVPFYIEEFVKSLKELRVIEREDNTYRLVKELKAVSIPSKVQDVIMARVDTLSEGAKRLLQTGSVIGREFSHELIKQVTEIQEGELISDLSVLKDSELLYERGIYPESSYIFKHALTQEVAYNSLLLKQRKEIHGKIGNVLEALYQEHIEKNSDTLAYHYSLSDHKDKALEYLDLANCKAKQVCAVEEAKAYFVESMKVLDAMPDTNENKERRISLLLKQWEMFWLLYKIPEYRDLLIRYEAMAEELGNQGILGQFYVRLGSCEQWFGELDKSIKTLIKAIELCGSTGNTEYVRDAYFHLQRSYYWSGDYDLCLESGENFLKILDSDFDPSSYVYSVSVMAWAYADLGNWERATEEGKRALKLAEKYSNDNLISYAAFSLAYMYNYKKDLARAVEYGELSAEKATTPLSRVSAMAALGYALCLVGELRKGINLLNQLLLTNKAEDYLGLVPWLNVMLGEGYWLAGEPEKSKQILEEALDLGERVKMKLWIGWAHLILGEIEIKNNLDKAATHFERSVSIFTKIATENPLAHAYSGCGRLNKHQGNMEQAREYFEKALEIFERLGTLIEPEKIRKELAELPKA